MSLATAPSVDRPERLTGALARPASSVDRPERLPEPPPLLRRERRKIELRARILDAAMHLVRKRGFQATKVAEICARADVAHKTFFNHFPSKQHLLREIAQVGMKRLLVEIEAVRRPELSTRERLLEFFATVATNTAQGGPLRRELVSELAHVLNDSGRQSEPARLLHSAFGAIVRDGLAAGDVTRRHKAETLTEMILGAYYVLMFNYANLENFPIEQQAAAHARLLGDALSLQVEETNGPS